jgi:hypothetical protein
VFASPRIITFLSHIIFSVLPLTTIIGVLFKGIFLPSIRMPSSTTSIFLTLEKSIFVFSIFIVVLLLKLFLSLSKNSPKFSKYYAIIYVLRNKYKNNFQILKIIFHLVHYN